MVLVPLFREVKLWQTSSYSYWHWWKNLFTKIIFFQGSYLFWKQTCLNFHVFFSFSWSTFVCAVHSLLMCGFDCHAIWLEDFFVRFFLAGQSKREESNSHQKVKTIQWQSQVTQGQWQLKRTVLRCQGLFYTAKSLAVRVVTDVYIPCHVAPVPIFSSELKLQIFTSSCCVKTTDEKLLLLPTTGCMLWMLSVDLLGLVTTCFAWCKTATIVQPTVQLYDICTSVSILLHKQTMHVTQKCSVESSYSYWTLCM